MLSIIIYSVFYLIINAVEILTLCVEKCYRVTAFQYRHRGFGLVYTSRPKLLYPCSKLTRSKLCPAQSCRSSISTSPALDPCATVDPQFPGYIFYSGWLKSTQEHVFVFRLCSTITNNLIQVVTSCRYPLFLYMTSICYKVY